MGIFRLQPSQPRMKYAERNIDRHGPDHADGVKRGKLIQIVADGQHKNRHGRRDDRRESPERRTG
jgi:hypothetical protein